MLVLHNNIEDYTLTERMALEDAFHELEPIAQTGMLSIDETRIRVAYRRLQREENFKISQATVKKVAAPKVPKVPKEKVVKITKVSIKENIAKASKLFTKQLAGEELSSEEQLFLEEHLKIPPPP